MKKLMVAAAIVCAAVAVQASQFKWGATGIKGPDGESAASGLTATIWAYETTAGEASAKSFGTATINNGVIAQTMAQSDELIGGKTYSMYFTMTSGASEFKSATLAQLLPTNNTAPVKMFTTGTWTTTPEPTSALLLLLGVAGLALKRKQA